MVFRYPSLIILKRFNCFDVAPVRTPYDPSTHLRKNKESSISQTEYAKIISSVMFLMNYTRPDIAYVVSRLSRYTHNPSSELWNVVHRLLRYLRGFYDANWVTDNDEVSSTSGYVFTLGAGAISWKSSKLTCIARSTMESEFIALRLAGKKLSG
ncbi:secreted RxLR effector protein 161-like [Nicotiana tabacum]|uniref:Secreted RxLR effector protein 161-like n=1 Tax=Nicotiana tabacum TaxID=4097 RepID=A0AC58S6P6_TOBAC